MPAAEPNYAILDEARLRAEVAELAAPELRAKALDVALAAQALADDAAELAVVPYRRGGRRKRALAFMIEDGDKFAFGPKVNHSVFAVVLFRADGAFALHLYRPAADPERHPLLQPHAGRKKFRKIPADVCGRASVGELVAAVRAAFGERCARVEDQYRR